MADQPSLFADLAPSFDSSFASLGRVDLDDTAWVEHAPDWLTGDEQLFTLVRDAAAWEQPVVKMYDREVLTPRLVARLEPPHPEIVAAMVEALSDRYGIRLDRVSAGYYRDGQDSVAWHGDRVAREREQALVATVSLGGPRRFLMKPTEGGPSRRWELGRGDLFVMGGSSQRTWRHTVPKVKSAAPRIALMFRHEYG